MKPIKTYTEFVNEGRKLRVFDFDDTLAKSDSNVHIIHKTGKVSILTPGQFATYKPKPGDEMDFAEFNKLLKNPKPIQHNIDLLRKMLQNPQKKVTVLTARSIAYPIRRFFKQEYNLDVYVVALGDSNPLKKADWIESHIQKGYTDIAFMDDSIKNISAVNNLQKKYPHIKIRTKHIS